MSGRRRRRRDRRRPAAPTEPRARRPAPAEPATRGPQAVAAAFWIVVALLSIAYAYHHRGAPQVLGRWAAALVEAVVFGTHAGSGG